MHIHQLNVRYDTQQDRLLARVNTDTGQETRLWFTRRLTLGMLPLVRKLVGERAERDAAAQSGAGALQDPKVRQWLGEFKKDQVLQQADFKTPFKEPPAHAAAAVPLLVGEVALTMLPSGILQTVFRGAADEPVRREVKLELDSAMMHGFLHLLELAFTASHWATADALPLDAARAAEARAAPKPQYLN